MPGVASCGSHRRVLAAVGGGDEGAVVVRPGEHDVARLVADQQGAHDAGSRQVADVDDADAVGEMVDHPDFGGGAQATATGSRPTGTDAAGDKVFASSAEDLEAVVRRIHGEQEIAAGESASGRTCPVSNNVKDELPLAVRRG